MPVIIDIKADYLYQKGFQKGLEMAIEKREYENKYNFVANLFQHSDFSDEKIAFVVDVDIAFVEKVKLEFENKKG